MKKDIAFRHTYLNFGQRPFDLKIRGTSVVSLNDGAQFGGGVLWRAWEKGNERNGQISVNVESGISKASRGGNINVDTFIPDHVVFFLEFVVFSSERERKRESL